MRAAAAAALTLLFSVAARAEVRWSAAYEKGDLKQWGAIHCGGQDGSCPCMAPFWDPTWQVSYGPGSCNAANSNAPLSMAPSNGRFQIVDAPLGAGKAMRVELRQNDLWPCQKDCGWATNRNELVYSKDVGTAQPTAYKAGDERYFSWSSYLPAGFAKWTCNSQLDLTARDSLCPNGVPASGYNPWNVLTQWHHSTDNGTPPLAVVLRRSKLNATGYAIVLNYGYSGGGSDRELWREELATDTWYDFVVHVKWSTTTTGLVELWVGKNGGARAKQTLSCPAGASQSCTVATLYKDGATYFVQGLYRNTAIADTSVIYHRGTMDGDSYADVTNDFSLALSPASVTVAPGQAAAYTVQTTGNGQPIALSAAGLPPGVSSAIFTPATVAAGAASTLVVTTNADAADASGSFIITGQAGNSTRTAVGTLTLTAPVLGPAPIATLVDSFGGAAIDPALWSIPWNLQGTIGEGAGALSLAPNAGSSATGLVVASNATYALTGSRAHVRAASVVSAQCGVNNRFTVKIDSGNAMGFLYECGKLYAYAKVNGTTTYPAQLAYSAATHAYWRVREAGGTLYWDTSADKVTWTQRASKAAWTSFGAVRLELGAETYSPLAAPGVAKYAGLNQ